MFTRKGISSYWELILKSKHTPVATGLEIKLNVSSIEASILGHELS